MQLLFSREKQIKFEHFLPIQLNKKLVFLLTFNIQRLFLFETFHVPSKFQLEWMDFRR